MVSEYSLLNQIEQKTKSKPTTKTKEHVNNNEKETLRITTNTKNETTFLKNYSATFTFLKE